MSLANKVKGFFIFARFSLIQQLTDFTASNCNYPLRTETDGTHSSVPICSHLLAVCCIVNLPQSQRWFCTIAASKTAIGTSAKGFRRQAEQQPVSQ